MRSASSDVPRFSGERIRVRGAIDYPGIHMVLILGVVIAEGVEGVDRGFGNRCTFSLFSDFRD